MKIYAREVEKIMRTLPVGYYLGSDYDVSLDEEIDSSFFSPTENKIVISFKQIASAMEEVEDRSEMEMMVRSNFYHELSHVILTPHDLVPDDIINVYEDERIERYMANYYKGVDFKKNVVRTCHYHGEAPNPANPFEVFYYAVRFRHGTPAQLRAVEYYVNTGGRASADLIAQYAYQLWYSITGIRAPKKKEQEAQRKEMSLPKSDEEQPISSISDEDFKTQFEKEAPQRGFSMKKEAVKRMMRETYVGKLNKFNPAFNKKASILFEGFNKRTNAGNAFCAYSGVLNPRNADRADCRFFDRRAMVQGVNKFGKVHVNLFLDVSGSFIPNQDATNALLAELIDIEKRFPYFSFDVIACGEGEQKMPKSHRFIICSGGNHLDTQIMRLYREAQKPNCANYNIILFDGDANPFRMPRGKNAFSAFDHENCFLISEFENQQHIEKAVSKAKVVYSVDYLKELEDNLLNALRLALQ